MLIVVSAECEPLGGRISALVVAPIAANMEIAVSIVKEKTSPFFTKNSTSRNIRLHLK